MISHYFEKHSSVVAEREEGGIKRKDDLWSWEKIEKAIDISALSRSTRSEFISTRAVEALARLTIEIGEKLKDYDTLVSDDASGRLVTLFLRKLVDSERKKVKKGPVKTYFVSTGRHGMQEVTAAVEGFLRDKNRGGAMGKTLVVTEFISSGQSIGRLINILKRCDIDFDIAAVSVEDDPEGHGYSSKLKHEFTKRLYYGTIGKAGLDFYGKSRATGVTSRSGEVSPHPMKTEVSDALAKRLAREDMNLLADECAKLLESNP